MCSKHKLLTFGFIVILFFFFIFPSKIFAQVVINEFSSSTSDNDWVELYNTSDSSVDLVTYSLVDAANNSKPFSCVLAPRGFVVAEWSNRLNNDGDTIRLKTGGNFVDCVAYGNGAGQKCEGRESVDLGTISFGEFGARSIDGAGTWNKVTVSTKDAPNDGSMKNPLAVCSIPTPTPTPSPTPKNTPTPTSSPISKPTLTPKPTSTPTSTKSPTPKPTSTLLQTNEAVASVATEESNLALGITGENSPTATVESSSSERKKPSILAILLIITGVGLLGFAGHSLWKTKKSVYTNNHEEIS